MADLRLRAGLRLVESQRGPRLRDPRNGQAHDAPEPLVEPTGLYYGYGRTTLGYVLARWAARRSSWRSTRTSFRRKS